MKTINPFKVTDRVRLRDDVLGRHSQSVPAHAGYTKEQFRWRALLKRLAGQVGTISRIFEGSKHVNVDFEATGTEMPTTIGIDWTELVKIHF